MSQRCGEGSISFQCCGEERDAVEREKGSWHFGKMESLMTLITDILLEWMNLKAQLWWAEKGMGGEKGGRWGIQTTPS